jgi:hypothetical protein
VKEVNGQSIYDPFRSLNRSILRLGAFNAPICPGYFHIRGQGMAPGSNSGPLLSNYSKASHIVFVDNLTAYL